MTQTDAIDRVLLEVERARDEIVAFTTELIRIPSVNPPGAEYRRCAEVIGEKLGEIGLDVSYVEAVGRPEHSSEHPRVNVVGSSSGSGSRPGVHLNGHFDVVPPGDGWTVDPFGGLIRDGRIFGRGASDMKSGIAAAIGAVAAVRRVGVQLTGPVDVSGTVDEESGGFAGVAHLCETGWIDASRIGHVIIPEPFGPERICVGHKGVYWCDVIAHGAIAHGSMPHLGRSAIDDMAVFLERIADRLGPELAGRVTSMPVVPQASRHPAINVNAIEGGQAGASLQSPCVADRCVATLDRRFIPEESIDDVRREILDLVASVEADRPGSRFTVEDRMTVLPTRAPDEAPLILALEAAVQRVTGRLAERVGSPGTYDQKHITRIAGIDACVAYGPGPLEEAHQPDESCSIDDLVRATQVMALTLLDLLG